MKRTGRLTVRSPWEGVGDTAEGLFLLLSGKLEAIVDTIELVRVGGRGGADALLLQLVLVALGLSEARDDIFVCLEAGHVCVLVELCGRCRRECGTSDDEWGGRGWSREGLWEKSLRGSPGSLQAR